MAKKRLLLIGGGHAHMVTLANLRLFIEKGYALQRVHYFLRQAGFPHQGLYRPAVHQPFSGH